MTHYCPRCHRRLPDDPQQPHHCHAETQASAPVKTRFRLDWPEIIATLAVSSALAFVALKLFEAMF